jgi:hypothetical protein
MPHIDVINSPVSSPIQEEPNLTDTLIDATSDQKEQMGLINSIFTES